MENFEMNQESITKLKNLNDMSIEYLKTHAKNSKFKYKGVYEQVSMLHSTNPKFELIVKILLSQEETIKKLEERISHLENA
jgi:hypothetical protein